MRRSSCERRTGRGSCSDKLLGATTHRPTGGMVSDDNGELIALLREIRDLQQAHFERYKEFTAAAVAQGEQAMQESRNSLADSRQAQLAFQQQIIDDAAKARTTSIILAACSGVIQLVLI